MLQKIFVVLLGFIVSIVGALAPSGLFASTAGDSELAFQGTVQDETLASVDGEGSAFARVPVLWIEVDGRRVTEDAWGTGDLKELRFKVGVKDVEDKALVIGERVVDLHPTDVLTVRMFRGDFAYRDVSVAGATLQLQGVVKTTMLSQGDVGTKVRTELGGVADGTLASGAGGQDDGSVAYVVLDTGKRVDTLAIEEGGHRLFTEESTSSASAKNQPGNLLAKWVKIDGKTVREYTWGEGSVGRIEFEPAAKGSGTAVVAFDDVPSEALAGQRVVVEDFVGTYTAFPIAGGYIRLGLDGYAADYGVGLDNVPGLPLGEGSAPLAAFEYYPPNPRTTDTIRFTDRSRDDGVILFTMWTFGNESVTVLPDPTYSFDVPGTYTVTLKVTDDDLQTGTISHNITVRNADPIPDFDFSPKIVTSDTIVSFTDRSSDSDNHITNWTWDFGDGKKAYTPNPNHHFGKPGNASVTLTVRDNQSGSASLTKLIIVKNAPPLAAFDFSPAEPQSAIPVQFVDTSQDSDGDVVAWHWDFGDGTTGSGSSPTHAYKSPGLYTVTLTSTDDAGGQDSTSSQIRVVNRPAIVDFTYSPTAPAANTAVTFTSLAHDPDGSVLYYDWRFGHVGGQSVGSSSTQTFPAAGEYWVNHSVIDSSAELSWLNTTISIENTAPRVRLGLSANPALRDMHIQFTDLSTDPDGDAIIASRWDFGDGFTSYERSPVHAYSTLGIRTVTLTSTDASGKSASASLPVSIINARPVIDSVSVEPRTSVAGAPVAFSATAIDPDLRLGDELVYEWRFSDGVNLTGANVTRSFPSNGDYSVNITAIDIEGARSTPRTESIRIDYANPSALFASSVAIPTTNEDVQFLDASTSPNGVIVSRSWDFGDGTTSNHEDPVHRYTDHGEKIVRLTVTDEVGKQNTTMQTVLVNARPLARFAMDQTGTISIETRVAFNDLSSDVDGFIDTWTWNFGDGTVETYGEPTDPSHVFKEPGLHVVRLSVADNTGATHAYEQQITVENRRPVARWSMAAPSFLVNEAINFTSESYDPDGTAITGWHWTFGDSSSSTLGNTTHTYLNSGEYIVSLRVSDGKLQSALDQESVRFVRIGADHTLPVTVTARYLNGDPVDLDAADTSLRINLMRDGRLLSSYSKSQLVDTGDAYTRTLDVGEWARGDKLVLYYQNTSWQKGPTVSEHVLSSDLFTNVLHEFVIQDPLSANLTVHAGQRGFLLGESGSTTPEGIPVYHDVTEGIRGEGHVAFKHGVPARNADVRIEMRYMPLSATGGLLSGDGSALLGTWFGWCSVGTAKTDGTGDYAWATSRSLCSSDLLPYPPGLYEVRAYVTYEGRVGTYTNLAQFIVDPTDRVVRTLEAV